MIQWILIGFEAIVENFIIQEEKISIDESGMTQFDPLHTWEDHKAVWKMQVSLVYELSTRWLWSSAHLGR